MRTYGLNEILDIVVVGAGPAGLCVLHAAREAGLTAVAIDKGPVCGALLRHPTYMRWFSTADKLELGGFPLLTTEKNPTRQEYLQYCLAFVHYFGLEVVPYHEVTSLHATSSLWEVNTRDLLGRDRVWDARNVVAATGYYDNPRLLEVPGEGLPKVSHHYTEPHYYFGQDVLIIGGGNSAAEAALQLWRSGANVTIAMRGEKFDAKYWIEPDIENRIAERSIVCHRSVEVLEIRPEEVLLRNKAHREVVVPNDFVLAMTGYEPDTTLIERAGAQVDSKTHTPRLTTFHETTASCLYVAGTLMSGIESDSVFIENSREHGPRIVQHIIAKNRMG